MEQQYQYNVTAAGEDVSVSWRKLLPGMALFGGGNKTSKLAVKFEN
jgi:hypothetical protein